MKAGDKVVCVDDTNQTNETLARIGDFVVKGIVYQVRDVALDYEHEPGLRLIGVFGGWWRDGQEACFYARRFRLVSEVGHPPIAVQIPEEVLS